MTSLVSTSITTPAAEAVLTTAEAKTHLRVTISDDDTYIDGLVEAATNKVQAYTNTQLVNATIQNKYRDFPSDYFEVSRLPLVSVSSITYVDTDGTTQTLSTDVYEAIPESLSGYIVLKPDQVWPHVQHGKFAPVTVNYVAGYGAASDVPENIKSSIKLFIADLYENRVAKDQVKLYENHSAFNLLTPAMTDWSE